jgi:hypothetical protein
MRRNRECRLARADTARPRRGGPIGKRPITGYRCGSRRNPRPDPQAACAARQAADEVVARVDLGNPTEAAETPSVRHPPVAACTLQGVGGLVHPAALLAGCRPHLPGGFPEPERTVGDRNLRRRETEPRPFPYRLGREKRFKCSRSRFHGRPRTVPLIASMTYCPAATSG